MCSFDLEPCDVWVEQPVKAARKRHACSACGGDIDPGQGYVKHFSVFEGYSTSEKICTPCFAAREEFSRAHGITGTPGRFAEDLRDCFGETDRAYYRAQDRRWRSLYAAMLIRGRAAERRKKAA